MSNGDLRLAQLQQIPLFALKQRLTDFASDPDTSRKLSRRLDVVLETPPANLENAIKNLTREEVTGIINETEIISYEEINELFEEFRYGQNPFFRIFRFNRISLGQSLSEEQFKRRLETAFENIQAEDNSYAYTKGYKLNDVQTLPDSSKVLEGNFRFLQHLDYIDHKQVAISTYRTIYGFFWISFEKGYAVIHPQRSNIIEFLKAAIEEAFRIKLMTIRITEEFKKTLGFINPANIRSGSFYDPDPNSKNFQRASFRDESPYEKGLDDLQKAYPESPIARYKDSIDDEKETSIVVSSKGVLGVYGRHSATLFRQWALGCLQEIVEQMNEFQNKVDEFVETLDLLQMPQYRAFSARQRKSIVRLVVAMLSFKRFSDIVHVPLNSSPLQFAAVLKNDVQVQIPYSCSEAGCGDRGHFRCPTCEQSALIVNDKNGITIQCANHRSRTKRWESTIPLLGDCANTHLFELHGPDIEESLEIFLGPKILKIIEDVVKQQYTDFEFDLEQNVLYISGSSIIYHPDRRRVIGPDGSNVIQIDKNVHGNSYEMGNLKNIGTANIGNPPDNPAEPDSD